MTFGLSVRSRAGAFPAAPRARPAHPPPTSPPGRLWGLRTLTRRARVTIVQPGAFRTEFSGRSLRVTPATEAYLASVGSRSEAFQRSHGSQPGDPRRGAEAIVAAVELDEPPLRLPLGVDAFAWLETYLSQRLHALEAARGLGADTAFRTNT